MPVFFMSPEAQYGRPATQSSNFQAFEQRPKAIAIYAMLAQLGSFVEKP